MKGLRLKPPRAEGDPADGLDGPRGLLKSGFEPGVPGELGDGRDGMLGEEKLRLPLLPEDPPPPARAQA
ncbi:MAG: hypothetical protein HGA84_00155 [Syntrophobacteraceae bacterium]|nr:hypothetical protein [Syntrophobacteraceae bacterium]